MAATAASDFTFDKAGRLTTIDHRAGQTPGSGTQLAGYGYTWNQRHELKTLDFLPSAYNAEDVTYSYDLRGQLTGADRAGGSHDETYAYDDNGNRETVTNSSGANQDYDTDPNNQLESDGTFSYLYDDEGNRTHRFLDDNDNGLLDSGDDDITEYTWDHRNRLVEVKERAVFGGAVTREIDYAYDAFDRMVKRTVDANGASAGGVTAEYLVYDGQRAVLTLESDGDVLRRHLWADAVDMLLAEEDAVEGLFIHLQDHQGTTRDVVDDDGDLVNHVNFDAFGNIENQTNAGDGYSIVWAGLIWDEPLAMYRAFYRLYDAAVGRWASEDPISFAGGTDSLSEYSSNSPTNLIDPTGLNPNKGGAKDGAELLQIVNHIEDQYRHKHGVCPTWNQTLKLLHSDMLREVDAGSNHYYIFSQRDNRWIDIRHFIRAAMSSLPPSVVEFLGKGVEYSQASMDVFDRRPLGERAAPGSPVAGNTSSAFGAEDYYSNALGAKFGQKLREMESQGMCFQLSTALSQHLGNLGVGRKEAAKSYEFLPDSELIWQAWHQRPEQFPRLRFQTLEGAKVGIPRPPMFGEVRPLR